MYGQCPQISCFSSVMVSITTAVAVFLFQNGYVYQAHILELYSTGLCYHKTTDWDLIIYSYYVFLVCHYNCTHTKVVLYCTEPRN